MLRSMQLRNFRSWEDTGKISLAPITGFFGTNSSGKSSLLRFLLLLKQTSESSDQGAQLELGGRGSLVDFGSMSDLLFGHDSKRTLGISLGWDQHAWPLESPEGEAAARWRTFSSTVVATSGRGNDQAGRHGTLLL